ncbi:hypothetical protein DL764_008076 [Monosporascus ibericus]|uniref:Uncharacterized protein n=1 Tax=Monosporascus ibericus TaxID=155417 RepID=A0A4Q4T0P5_9PEZI|nr:hypothetical protein DL764_008076 [Monosporascus ibericus]
MTVSSDVILVAFRCPSSLISTIHFSYPPAVALRGSGALKREMSQTLLKASGKSLKGFREGLLSGFSLATDYSANVAPVPGNHLLGELASSSLGPEEAGVKDQSCNAPRQSGKFCTVSFSKYCHSNGTQFRREIWPTGKNGLAIRGMTPQRKLEPNMHT